MLNFAQLNSVILPELVLIIAAIIILLLEAFQGKLAKYASFLALAVVIFCLYYIFGQWNSNKEGFYKALVLDNFALYASVIYLLSGGLIILAAMYYLESKKIERNEFYVILLLAIAGMIFISSSNDLISIFISLEIFSIALYVLVSFEKVSKKSIEGATKYFILGTFSAAILLYGIILIYGVVGSTNIMDLKNISATNVEQKVMLYIGTGLILAGLAFKISLVPFHMWTPDAYEGAPTVITAFMAAATKTAAFTVLIRVFIMNFNPNFISLEWIIWVLSVITMTVGNLIALSQENIKRLLAYSSIAHAGYISVGLVPSTSKSDLASVMYYLLVYAVMNIGAFLVVAYLESGESFLKVEHYKGLGFKNAWLAIALTWFLLCLAGLPPTSGFIAKYYVFLSAAKKGYYLLVVISVLNSVLAAYYYLRVIVYMWMFSREKGLSVVKKEEALTLSSVMAIIVAFIITLPLSFMPSRFIRLAMSF